MSQHENKFPDIAAAVAGLAADTVYPAGKPPLKVTAPDRPRKLALVLSGGGASGAFEAGVIEETAKAITDHNLGHPDNKLSVDVVIGTSTGALNSYGLLLDTLYKRGLLAEPAWLASGPGTTLNFRLWRYLTSFKKPSEFVLDKPWLLHLIQGAGTWSRWMTLFLLFVMTPLVLAGLFLLPGLLGLGAAVATLPCWAGWLLTGLALALPVGLILLLARNPGLLQNSGRPVFWALLILGPSAFSLGCLQTFLAELLAAGTWGSLAGHGIVLLLAPVTLFYTVWSISGNALFGNARLKRLLSAIADAGSTTGNLRNAISKKKAEDLDHRSSRAVSNACAGGTEPPGTHIFTATNISAEKQGLFLLGPAADAVRLAEQGWLPVRYGATRPDCATIAEDELITGVIASTAIPATYPPEILNYDSAGPRRHVFVDGGVLDFAAYHVAIDLGCTHVLAVETDSMDHDLMQKRQVSGWMNIFANIAATSYTGSDEEAREEAAGVAETNRRVADEGLASKRLVLFYRIAPAENERMINADEFDGRFKDGRQVNTLGQWIAYGQAVNPAAGSLPPWIWYRDPNGNWQRNESIQGPVLWDASFVPSPGSVTD